VRLLRLILFIFIFSLVIFIFLIFFSPLTFLFALSESSLFKVVQLVFFIVLGLIVVAGIWLLIRFKFGLRAVFLVPLTLLLTASTVFCFFVIYGYLIRENAAYEVSKFENVIYNALGKNSAYSKFINYQLIPGKNGRKGILKVTMQLKFPKEGKYEVEGLLMPLKENVTYDIEAISQRMNSNEFIWDNTFREYSKQVIIADDRNFHDLTFTFSLDEYGAPDSYKNHGMSISIMRQDLTDVLGIPEAYVYIENEGIAENLVEMDTSYLNKKFKIPYYFFIFY